MNGSDTSVSELLKHGVVVKPTGSVTTLWAKPATATKAVPNEVDQTKILRCKLERNDMTAMKVDRLFAGASGLRDIIGRLGVHS